MNVARYEVLGSGHTEVRQVPDGTRHFLKTQPITKVVGYFHWVRAGRVYVVYS
jgi:hypothetical protein